MRVRSKQKILDCYVRVKVVRRRGGAGAVGGRVGEEVALIQIGLKVSRQGSGAYTDRV